MAKISKVLQRIVKIYVHWNLMHLESPRPHVEEEIQAQLPLW